MPQHKSQGGRWELRKGGQIIGRMSDCTGDFPWFICHFEPEAGFSEYRPLFKQLDRLAQEIETPGTVELFDQLVERLNAELSLVPSAGHPVEMFLLYIQGDRADFRVIFADEAGP